MILCATQPSTVLCSCHTCQGKFQNNDAWDSWFEYLSGWLHYGLPVCPWPSLQASSVWCAVLHQRMYLFQYSSKKSNIGFKWKWTAQVPPFGAGPSLSCFCCSRSLSSGEGPGPDHKDCKANRVFITPYRMVLSAVLTTFSVACCCAMTHMDSQQPPPVEAHHDPRPDHVGFVMKKETLGCEGNR